ncbi:MAG: hypothetical protein [Bacteriophage sp.]|nr:MAG: hypothetical protein [Bacteriophage sp.]
MITIKNKELEKVNIPLNSVYTPVIPCVLDGNLSFLEMVWKLLYHINVIVDAVNANHGDIEDLAQAINDLIVDKLSVMWVEVDFTARPIKANKTFAEIAEGMRKGIVFVTIKNEDDILIFIPIFSSNSAINFLRIDAKNEVVVSIRPDESVTLYQYSFATEDHPTTFQAQVTFNNTVDFNKFTEFHEATRFYKLITADSGITVPTATAASGRKLAANLEYVGNVCSETLTAAKEYADTQDAVVQKSATIYTNTKCGETLAAAKTYADTQDQTILTSAKTYTDTKCGETLTAANTYTDTVCSKTLAAAKTYADIQDQTILTSAKTYTDTKFVHVKIVKNVDGSLTTDSTFSIIYLNITRGAVVDVNFSSENNRNSTYLMRNTIITPTKLTFIGYDETATLHTCTIDSDNNITYT